MTSQHRFEQSAPRLWQPAPTVPPPPRLLGRRTLLGSASAALFLAACSDSGDGPNAASTGSTVASGGVTTTAPGEDVRYFRPLFNAGPGYSRVEREQRLTFGLFDWQNQPVADAPPTLDVQLRFEGKPASADDYLRELVGDPIPARHHDSGLDRGYYEFRFTPDREGIWTAMVVVADQPLEVQFQVDAAENVSLFQIGQRMTPVETATFDEPLGIDPLCTRPPEACDLHTESFAAAITADAPTALLISTPAYCQVAICGPVLELLIEAAEEHPEITFIHSEVYANPLTAPSVVEADLAGVVEFLGLTYEPALFLVGADGLVVDRLDNIWDREEQAESLAKLLA